LELGGKKYSYKCKRITGGHLEIVSPDKTGRVWVGVSDLNKKGKDKEDFFTAIIKRFIRHSKSYKGSGKYGKYGGYDISLVELDNPVPERFATPVCLPQASMQEICVAAVFT
jgi:hypothetical protein